MATQTILSTTNSPPANPAPSINVPSSFQIEPQDPRLQSKPVPESLLAPPPLGILSNFKGTFVGSGLNMIFRPNSGQTTFSNPVPGPALGVPPNENVLELNLTAETLSFSNPVGNVPNRGLEQQPDIFLNGVPYIQSVSDVTDPKTGRGDASPSPIHFEPGLWMHIPASTTDPSLNESLTRMASIPHGTTINAQCLEPTSTFPGPPPFETLAKVDISPFPPNTDQTKTRIVFASQTAAATNTPRLPQDLTNFMAAGTITQDILDNPNLVLLKAIETQNIINTVVFQVTTVPTAPELGGGTTNIAFLQGTAVTTTNTTGAQQGPNALAFSMTATFWIEQVQTQIQVPAFTVGQPALLIQAPADASPNGQTPPTFKVLPPRNITQPTIINVSFTQIQYMQTVLLNFAGLSWPHVSCATLIPSGNVHVPNSAFGP